LISVKSVARSSGAQYSTVRMMAALPPLPRPMPASTRSAASVATLGEAKAHSAVA